MFYNIPIDKLYIINGLARSGNHLFITWLLSSFNKGEVYYLNNIKTNYYGLTSNKQLNVKKILRNHIVTSDNFYGKKININARQNLVNTYRMYSIFKHTNIKIKVLIISLENKEASRLDILEKIFSRAKKVYKIIILRDILNLFCSRIESEKKRTYNVHSGSWTYNTDKITIKYWLDNYRESKKKKYILFNYNKFICYEISRKALAKKLSININRTHITKNLFGITRGSSFTNTTTAKIDYFTRWLNCKNNPLMEYILKNQELLEILCKDFSMCLKLIDSNIKICRNTYKISFKNKKLVKIKGVYKKTVKKSKHIKKKLRRQHRRYRLR